MGGRGIVLVMAAMLVSATLISATPVAQTGNPPTPVLTTNDTVIPPNDTALYRAIDEWIARGLVRYEIAGAALAIVRNGSIVHTRGFGRGDITRDAVVNPDSTVFHLASVTKLLTAIAAMQLVESNALQLHTDVRPSLGAIDAAGWADHPVTLHQLLTHTAGLDTRWIGMATADPTSVRALDEYLERESPPIIDTPGQVIRYSNHGFAHIGRLIEKASGMPWAQYVEQRVMQPIGMTQSRAQPRAPGANDARPYRYRVDTLEEPGLFEHVAPGGAARGTASDVARLMIAILDTTTSVPLSPHGKRMLLEPQMHIGGGVPGFAYGSFTYPNPYVRAASMAGEVPGFSTRLLMIPSLQLGVVVMVNRKDPSLAVEVFDSLLVRIAGKDTSSTSLNACVYNDSASDVSISRRDGSSQSSRDDIVGSYRSNVYERGSFLKIAALLGPTLTVEADTGNSLVVVNPIEDKAARWFPVSDRTWHTRGGDCMTLTSSDDTSLLTLTTRFAGPVMLEHVRWYNGAPLVVSLAVLALLLLLVVLVLEAVRSIRRRSSPASTTTRAVTIALAAGHLLFVVLFAVGLAQLAIINDDRFATGTPTWYNVVLLMPLMLWSLTAMLAVLILRSKQSTGAPRRAYVVLAASVVLAAIQQQWHMHAL